MIQVLDIPYDSTLQMRALFDTLTLDNGIGGALISITMVLFICVLSGASEISGKRVPCSVVAKANIAERRCGRLYPDAEHLLCYAVCTAHA